jgi:hypothetical protein
MRMIRSRFGKRPSLCNIGKACSVGGFPISNTSGGVRRRQARATTAAALMAWRHQLGPRSHGQRDRGFCLLGTVALDVLAFNCRTWAPRGGYRRPDAGTASGLTLTKEGGLKWLRLPKRYHGTNRGHDRRMILTLHQACIATALLQIDLIDAVRLGERLMRRLR